MFYLNKRSKKVICRHCIIHFFNTRLKVSNWQIFVCVYFKLLTKSKCVNVCIYLILICYID